MLTVFVVLPIERRKLNTFNWRNVRHKRSDWKKKITEGDGQEPIKCLKGREDPKISVGCLLIKFLERQ